MKSLLEYINESLDKQTLSDEFKTTLNSLFNDWDKNFKAQYSLNFIYNISSLKLSPTFNKGIFKISKIVSPIAA